MKIQSKVWFVWLQKPLNFIFNSICSNNIVDSTLLCDVTIPIILKYFPSIDKHALIQNIPPMRGSPAALGQIAPGRGNRFAPGQPIAPGQIGCRGSSAVPGQFSPRSEQPLCPGATDCSGANRLSGQLRPSPATLF